MTTNEPLRKVSMRKPGTRPPGLRLPYPERWADHDLAARGSGALHSVRWLASRGREIPVARNEYEP